VRVEQWQWLFQTRRTSNARRQDSPAEEMLGTPIVHARRAQRDRPGSQIDCAFVMRLSVAHHHRMSCSFRRWHNGWTYCSTSSPRAASIIRRAACLDGSSSDCSISGVCFSESLVVTLNTAHPFGGSTAPSMDVCFTPRIRRFCYSANRQLLITSPGRESPNESRKSIYEPWTG